MNLTGGIVLYAVIWFMVFFVVLPLRLQSQDEAGQIVPGTHASAPHDPRLRRKALITTGIATALWAVIATVILSGVITIQDLDWFDRIKD
ncbi:MAG: DUF1467 family protein [Sphingomonadales bacterium]|nr:DUF1467 family protein [Sphingomonadales bacterium]